MDHNFVVKPRDVCRIIKECAKSQVSEFRLGGLYLAFGPRDPSAPRSLGRPQTKANEQALKIKEEAELKTRQDQNTQDFNDLILTDPFAAEQIVEGELEVGGDERA